MDAQPGDARNSRLIGTTVSHYRLLERLAAGVRGGAVFKAQDLELERLVALKLLPAVGRDEDRLHLASEAAAASALEHPNICPVYEVGETEDGRLFVAMAFLEGETLAAKIARGPLKSEVAVDLASQVASGLARAHEHGLVHRNLKASNVLVTSDGQARILDFGIASLDDRTRITGEDTPDGLLAYRAPEQLRGEPADLRADVWSLGVILYEMLTGQRPFPNGALSPASELVPPSALREGVSPELDRIAARALARKRGERYARADDLRADLRALGGSKATVPTFSRWPDQLPPVTMFNVVPREVGPYRVGEILGGGGMGIVYRAEDTRLGRTVALKFLPPELTRDPVAKARFLQEARTASALDHPNICTVYDVGETENHQLYLAMPCYDGETLRRKVERGPLLLPDAVDYALQVSKGLAKAHRQGIVHRDIKPANLMVTGDGVVKILDFGIAKLAGEAGLTRTGSTLGTPAYMSPEQMRGTEVDGRTDLWALGVVMYEMVTGRRPFLGDHESGLRQAILEEEPEPLIRLRPDAPPELASVIQRLLAKDVAGRYPTADAAVADLRLLAGGSSGSVPTQSTVPIQPPPRRAPWLWIGAAATLVVLAAVGGYLLRSGGDDRVVPVQATFTRLTEQEGGETFPSLSPDGNYFVYVKASGDGSDIFLQRVGGGNPINLTPDTPWVDTQPAFSPDGQQIAFRSEREGGGIFVMGATGESVRRVTDFGYNPAWSPDAKAIAVATEGVVEPGTRTSRSQIWRIGLATGERRLVAPADAVQPSWSPDGRRLAYWGVSEEGSKRGVWTVAVDGGEAVKALSDGFLNWNPVWSPDGAWLYFISDRNGSLNVWRLAIDQDTGRISGDPAPVTASSQSIRFLSMSRDGGHVAYATDERRNTLESMAFDAARLETAGEAVPVVQGAKAVRTVDPSPDGQWLVFDTLPPREDLFIVKPDGSGLRQLTRDDHRDRIPRWSPDGRLILFYSNRSGRYEAWSVQADGSRTEQLTRSSGQQPTYCIWSPDGRRLACSRDGTVLVDLSRPVAGRTFQPLPGADRLEGHFGATSWSPDGLAGIVTRKDGSYLPGIVFYSFEARRFERLTDGGENPIWLPGLPVLLYPNGGAIHAFDLRAREDRKLLTPPAGSAYLFANASRDARRLYLVRRSDEGDIWMLNLD
jgi:serine/threonine protein kinase/Tol biopolymer transport system component